MINYTSVTFIFILYIVVVLFGYFWRCFVSTVGKYKTKPRKARCGNKQ